MRMKHDNVWKALSTVPAWQVETTQSMIVVIISKPENIPEKLTVTLFVCRD